MQTIRNVVHTIQQTEKWKLTPTLEIIFRILCKFDVVTIFLSDFDCKLELEWGTFFWMLNFFFLSLECVSKREF